MTVSHRGSAVLVVLLSLLSAAPLFAQAAAEDSKGSSTVLLDGAFVGVNTADSSVQIAVSKLASGAADDSSEKWFYAFKAKGKAENGLATLIGSGEIAPGAKFEGTIGRKLGASQNAVGLKASIGVSRLVLFDANAAPDMSTTKPVETTGELSVIGNLGLGTERIGMLAFGMTAKRTNNWDALKKVKVVRRVTVPSNAGETREEVSETEARSGAFENGWIGSVDGDLILKPLTAPLSTRGYVRLGIGSDTLRQSLVGVDVSILRNDDPVFGRLVSIFLEYADGAGKDTANAWSVGLAVSLPITTF